MTLISPHDIPFSLRTLADLSTLREIRRKEKLAAIKKPRLSRKGKDGTRAPTKRKKRQPRLSQEVLKKLLLLPPEMQEQMKAQLLAEM